MLRTRLNVLVLLTLALAGESPTCILHEGIHTPYHARSKYHKQLAKLSFDRKTFLVDLTAEVCFFFNRYVLRPRVNMPCIHIPRNVLGVSLVTDVVCFNVWNLESDGMRRWPRGPPLSLFFSSLLILRQMGGKKAQAHYTSMYFHTCRVSI